MQAGRGFEAIAGWQNFLRYIPKSIDLLLRYYFPF
jgi:hypothetical protein